MRLSHLHSKFGSLDDPPNLQNLHVTLGQVEKVRHSRSPAVPGSRRENSGGLSAFKDILVSTQFHEAPWENPNSGKIYLEQLVDLHSMNFIEF
ncbi:hypothetical protein AALO_G00253950 [Alosa alosa]|uniref:Uncharacterized protein n=1 Tax=Alosa alosa TaxID=278164 RepID=A0AAV6FNI9_9TELE|nr:hypothetical protein AALO_G00253950 [Alosa alosa]